MNLDVVNKQMAKRNLELSEYATRDKDAIRFREITNDFRTPFFRDIDRIIYSLSYTRYIDKTQVFSLNDNDNISKRMTHVQMVSKIARTIGRALGLNEDLIEAAALGHDLGHVPFGHVGESILNEISLSCGEGYFNHNVQSVRILRDLENNGKGSNITLQVLDAIMCHNGELELREYRPVKKTKEEFIKQYEETYKNKKIVKELVPMTLEGCVVRVSDIIGYIGRDIEDALRLGIIQIEDVPLDIRKLLGSSNKEIINTFVTDIVMNSYGKNYLMMSEDLFKALVSLKKFNYEYIYNKANSEEDIELYKRMFNKVFACALRDVKNNDESSNIYQVFLKEMSKEYLINTSDERKVIDYIAGMTDDYLIKQYNELVGEVWQEEN